MDDNEATPSVTEVLAAIEHTLSNATFKLGRMKTRTRGSATARDVTSVFYDVTAARHDVAVLLARLVGDDAAAPPPVPPN